MKTDFQLTKLNKTHATYALTYDPVEGSRVLAMRFGTIPPGFEMRAMPAPGLSYSVAA